MLVTIVGLKKVFHAPNIEGSDALLPFAMALGGAMVFSIAGVALSLLGVILVTIAVTALRYRAMSMYYFMWCYGILSLGLQISVGSGGSHFALAYHSPFGVFFLIFAIVKRGEFVQAGVRDALAAYGGRPK